MEQARKEIGPDAVLVTSRPASPETRHLGAHEVVCAGELPESTASTEAPSGEAPASGGNFTALTSPDSLLAEIRTLQGQLEAWRRATLRCFDQPRWISGHPELELLFSELIHAEVDRDLVQQLLAGALKRLRISTVAESSPFAEGPRNESFRKDLRLDRAELRAAVAEEIQIVFRRDSSLGVPTSSRKIIALVGPPGAGKTATLAKLAIRYGLPSRRPTLLLSFDTMRVAACEQLRWYASILGVAFQLVDTARGLMQALEEHQNKGLVFIDTPGFTLRELASGCDAADALTSREDVQTHLVLPASMRSSDLARTLAAYKVFRPERLIFTRMDETETVGPALSAVAATNYPVSFLGVGQRVPEDLVEANEFTLGSRILPAVELSCGALSAA